MGEVQDADKEIILVVWEVQALLVLVGSVSALVADTKCRTWREIPASRRSALSVVKR